MIARIFAKRSISRNAPLQRSTSAPLTSEGNAEWFSKPFVTAATIESSERQMGTDKRGPLDTYLRPRKNFGSKFGVPSRPSRSHLITHNSRLPSLIRLLVILHHLHHHHLTRVKMKFKTLIVKWKRKEYVSGNLTKKSVPAVPSKTVLISQWRNVRKSVKTNGFAMSATTIIWKMKRSHRGHRPHRRALLLPDQPLGLSLLDPLDQRQDQPGPPGPRRGPPDHQAPLHHLRVRSSHDPPWNRPDPPDQL